MAPEEWEAEAEEASTERLDSRNDRAREDATKKAYRKRSSGLRKGSAG